MISKCAVGFTCIAVHAGLAGGAVILDWTPSGQNTGDFTASTQASGLEVVSPGGDDEYAKATGLNYATAYPSGTNASWSANDINLSGFGTGTGTGFVANTTEADAVADDDFLTYTVRSTVGTLSISEISFDVWRNGTASPSTFSIRYAVNGGAFASAGSPTSVSSSGVSGGDPTLASVTATGLNIQAPQNQNVEIRLYGWGSTSNAGNVHVVSGALDGVVPEPALASALPLTAIVFARRRRSA
jgi:hypothetical protein